MLSSAVRTRPRVGEMLLSHRAASGRTKAAAAPVLLDGHHPPVVFGVVQRQGVVRPPDQHHRGVSIRAGKLQALLQRVRHGVLLTGVSHLSGESSRIGSDTTEWAAGDACPPTIRRRVMASECGQKGALRSSCRVHSKRRRADLWTNPISMFELPGGASRSVGNMVSMRMSFHREAL